MTCYNDDPENRVQCPTCGSPAGMRCCTTKRFLSDWHKSRTKAAAEVTK